MNRLIIIGASGHGKVVVDIARLCGYTDIVFLDANPALTTCAGYPVAGSDARVTDMAGDLFVAIGSAAVRRSVMERFPNRHFPVLRHPSAVIADGVTLGPGSAVMAGAVIGTGCIINTASSVDHDCVLGDYCHVSVGAHLAGTVSVGDETWIGAGATVSNNIRICGGCMIGAGAVVVRDIELRGTYVGVPARRIAPQT